MNNSEVEENIKAKTLNRRRSRFKIVQRDKSKNSAMTLLKILPNTMKSLRTIRTIKRRIILKALLYNPHHSKTTTIVSLF